MRPDFTVFLEELEKSYRSGSGDREDLYLRSARFFSLSLDYEDEMDALVNLAPDLIIRRACEVLEQIPAAKREATRLLALPADSKTAKVLLELLRDVSS
jgi:hypothetical protein